MTLNECVQYIRKDLVKNNVKLFLKRSESVYIDKEPLEGYYDLNRKELFVATKKSKEEWVSYLIHEYCHFKQWKKRTKAIRSMELEFADVLDVVNLWVHRKIELTPEQAVKYINCIKRMEREADQMTVSFIKRHNIPIDIVKYKSDAKEALKSYEKILETRRFE